MSPRLRLLPAMERGRLAASATLQDPDVRFAESANDTPCIAIEEGGVEVALSFPDLTSLRRFQRRLASLPVPRDP